MTHRLLFDEELSDRHIGDVFSDIIKKAVEVDEDVFLRWNGATVRVGPNDNLDSFVAEYNKQIGIIAKANIEEACRDGRDKHLYRIKNRLGEFYIVARSFDEAANEMKARLDKADYGFYEYRNVPGIEHLGVERFYHDKQSFSDREANLIVKD